jgi:hypothetical protein
MADQIVTAAETAVKAEVVTVKSKIVAFVKAHVSTAIGAVAGYGAAKLGILGLIWKLV